VVGERMLCLCVLRLAGTWHVIVVVDVVDVLLLVCFMVLFLRFIFLLNVFMCLWT